ncbi:uncharacterized protein LOC132050246 isoform X2 [Lycium ferocissimum]|uniref:uncharacterized protein LOC132050246 isoform X2 n=1 Tax=Lycium ferocissimum TaxID=112874 RepID=UPI00281617B5|nr:uncharacterized protein LOC132050246 isoform X2 [Lycium ferocissimum]
MEKEVVGNCSVSILRLDLFLSLLPVVLPVLSARHALPLLLALLFSFSCKECTPMLLPSKSLVYAKRLHVLYAKKDFAHFGRAIWSLLLIASHIPLSAFMLLNATRMLVLQLILGVESQGENISADLCIRLVGGGFAGITAASLTYPLDLVRTRLAAQTNVIYYRGIWHALQTISREEGIAGLYKGMGATLLGVGPNLAISFSVYDTVRSYWQSHRPDDSTVLVSLACGSLSGVASSTVTFPLDLVRRRMQLEGAGGRARVYKTGLFGTFSHIIQTEGLRGLYRGILPEYYKVVPSIGIVFMTYEKMKQLLSDID